MTIDGAAARQSAPQSEDARREADADVCVLTTIRNGAPFVTSFLAQLNQQEGARWEAVIVLDGCTDSTFQCLSDGIRPDDPRFQILAMPAIGRGGALNVGLSACNAPLIAILDVDDFMHPRRLALQSAWLKQHGDGVGVLASKFLTVRNPASLRFDAGYGPSIEAVDITQRLRQGNLIAHSSVVYNREALVSVGGFPTNQVGQFDYETYVRLAGAGFRVLELQAALCGVRTHSERSFLKRGRRLYRISSLSVQLKALRTISGSRLDGFFLAARALRTLLP